METIIPEKAYFRIGEVSKIVDVEPYVIRYWETEFKTINPVRTRTAQRLYRKKDVQELLTIKNLLYSQRFTIDGAKKQLHKTRSNSEPEDKDRDKERDVDKQKWLIRIKEELQQIRNIVS
jgi:DNA-binding transcriptional MerR regulator